MNRLHLEIGDEIALQTVRSRENNVYGFASARSDGATACVVDSVDGNDVSANPPRPRTCRFVVYGLQQFNDAARLQAAASNSGATVEKLAKLQADAQTEHEHNLAENELREGHPVVFGTLIQLLSPAADRYLSSVKEVASEDPSAIQCALKTVHDRSPLVWFRMMPGYDTRNEGDIVSMGDTIKLEATGTPGMFLHFDAARLQKHAQCELNWAARASLFHILPVAKYQEISDITDHVRGGDIVQLFHRHSGSYMQGDYSTCQLIQLKTSKTEVKHKRLVMQANLAWEIGRTEMNWSGARVQHMKSGKAQMKFTLKNAMTGKFLHDTGDDDGRCELHDKNDSANACWIFRPHNPLADEFQAETTQFVIENYHTGRSLHPAAAEVVDSEAERLQQEDGFAVLRLRCLKSISDLMEADLFVFKLLPTEWLTQFTYCQQRIGVLQSYRDALHTIKPGGSEPSLKQVIARHLRPDIDKDVEAPVTEVLREWLLKLTDSEEQDVLARDGPINAPLQRMLSEFGVVELTVELIETMCARKSQTVPRGLVEPEVIRQCDKHGSELFMTVKYCFRLLMVYCKSHRENTTKMYKWMDTILELLGYNFKAAELVTEIFKMERFCDKKYMKFLWGLARDRRMERYAKFLAVLVSDGGVPTKHNQDLVVDLIKDDHKKGNLKNFFDENIWTGETQDIGSMLSLNEYQLQDSDKNKREWGFHLALVELISLLCSGRHRSSIDFFLATEGFGFTYEKLLAIIGGQVKIDREGDAFRKPYEVRVAYAHLMTVLFVDREPFVKCAPLQITRVLSTVDATARCEVGDTINPWEEIENGEELRPKDSFSQLKDVVRSVLEEEKEKYFDPTTQHAASRIKTLLSKATEQGTMTGTAKREKFVLDTADKTRTTFIGALIDVAYLLLRFGFYDVDPHMEREGGVHRVLMLGKEAKSLGTLLVPILDGSTDRIRPAPANSDREHTRYCRNAENLPVIAIKRKCVRVIDVLFKLRDSFRIDMMLQEFYKGRGLEDVLIKGGEQYVVNPMHSDDKADTNQTWLENAAAEASSPKIEVDPDFNPMRSPRARMTKSDWALQNFYNVTTAVKYTKKVKEITHNMPRAKRIVAEAVQTRVFVGNQEESVTRILLDILRYDDWHLVLSGFESMLALLAQSVALCSALRKVVTVMSDEEVQVLHEVSNDCLRFRQLEKWLHDKNQCEVFINLIKRMQDVCRKTGDMAKTMFRCLDFELDACIVLRTKIDHPTFENVIKEVLKLVGEFCTNEKANQAAMSAYMGTIFVPFLEQPAYIEEAAFCIKGIVGNNAEMSLQFCSMLVDLAVRLTDMHGRRLCLLSLLESMLVVDGKAIEESQMTVCRGGMQSQSLLEADGDLERTIFYANTVHSEQTTPRQAMLEEVLGEKSTSERCLQHNEYFAKSLQVLAMCAAGKNPATELQCAALLSFTQIVGRLHEIYDHPNLVPCNSKHDASGMKRSYLSFLREVFIDTTSSHLLKMLTRPSNGIWFVDKHAHEDYARPIAEHLLDDIKCLGTETDLDKATREFVFSEAIPFFITFAEVVPQQTLDPKEWGEIGSSDGGDEGQESIRSMLNHAKQEAEDLLSSADRWTNTERKLLDKLVDAVAKYTSSDETSATGVRSGVDGNAKQQAENQSEDKPKGAAAKLWETNLAQLLNAMNLRKVKGTNRDLGLGVMRVAKAIWQTIEDDGEVQEITSYRAQKQAEKAAIKKAKDRKKAHRKEAKAEKKLGAATNPAAGSEEKDATTQDLASDSDDDDEASTKQVDKKKYAECLVRPIYKTLQQMSTSKVLDRLPMIQLCLDTVRAIPYTMHAFTAAQLSEAFGDYLQAVPLDSSTSPDLARCQFTMVKQGWGLLAFKLLAMDGMESLHRTALRILLALTGGGNRDVQDHLLQQLNDPIVCGTELCVSNFRKLLRHAGKIASSGSNQDMLATEILQVVSNMCAREHAGMQEYFARQPGYPTDMNFIADVIGFLHALEVRVKASIMRTDKKKGLEHVEKEEDKKLNQAEQAEEQALQSTFAIFRTLISMMDGPNRIAIAGTSVVSFANRILQVCKYDVDDIKVVNGKDEGHDRPKRRLVGQISRLLLSLLHGSPDEGVVAPLINSINWSVIKSFMMVLRNVMKDGVIDNRRKRRYPHDLITKDRALSAEDRKHAWITGEAYKFIAIVEKCRMNGSLFMGNETVQHHMATMLNDPVLLSTFTKRCGQVEIMHDGSIERMFFWMPPLNSTVRDAMIEDLYDIMDESARDNNTEKLIKFMDGAFEVANTVERELSSEIRNDWLIVADRALAAMLPGNTLLFCTMMICAICCAAFDHNIPSDQRFSHNPDTYGRNGGDSKLYYYVAFVILGSLHTIVCVLSFYRFVHVRVPVLLTTKKRKQVMQHNKFMTGAGNRRDRVEFLRCTVHVYGLNSDVANEATLRRAFGRYGVVAAIKIIAVPNKRFASWCILTFSKPDGVGKLFDDRNQEIAEASGNAAQGVMIRGPTNKDEVALIQKVTEPYLEGVSYLKELVMEAEFELEARQGFMLGHNLVMKLQAVANRYLGRFGRALPIEAVYELKWTPELLKALADIAFSLLGFWYSPLCFSYHLHWLSEMEGASIVISAIVTNKARLVTTILLDMMLVYFFAIFGVLFFQGEHTVDAVANEAGGGPCGNLLTCFVSYTYSGMTQTNMAIWLDTWRVPENVGDLYSKSTGRIGVEIMFYMCTSIVVISIITGIICDTFGELRSKQDEAAAYRSSTCFVTDIPYSKVPPEKSTDAKSYAYLLVYLLRADEHKLDPLERSVLRKLEMGDISWLPDGTCMTLQTGRVKREEEARQAEAKQNTDDTLRMLHNVEQQILQVKAKQATRGNK